jgi:K+-sensing histidine kinase KdpD
METFHSDPKIENAKKLQEQVQALSLIEEFRGLFETLPYIVFILNSKRQILFSNHSIIEKIPELEFKEFLGKRAGEYLNCIHKADCISGCGTSEHCRVCGAVNVVLRSQKEQKKIIGECTISSIINHQMTHFNFQVSSSPLKIKNEVFYVFSLVDISQEKRRNNLERIFFHDILNTAGTLAGLTDVINEVKDEEKKNELLKLIRSESHELLEEILAQKNLTEAENGELAIKSENISTIEMLDLVYKPFQKNNQNQINLEIDEDSDNTMFYSDKTILSRILKNMILNAVEASSDGEKVIIGAEETFLGIKFYVKNTSFIPRSIQLQLFQRNFSTKSNDRGLGTYSMKLLGEEYLQGKVSFSSDEENGTTFTIEIPQ